MKPTVGKHVGKSEGSHLGMSSASGSSERSNGLELSLTNEDEDRVKVQLLVSKMESRRLDVPELERDPSSCWHRRSAERVQHLRLKGKEERRGGQLGLRDAFERNEQDSLILQLPSIDILLPCLE